MYSHAQMTVVRITILLGKKITEIILAHSKSQHYVHLKHVQVATLSPVIMHLKIQSELSKGKAAPPRAYTILVKLTLQRNRRVFCPKTHNYARQCSQPA